MNINYDRIADALYIQLKKGKVRKTQEVSEYLLHDLDQKGNLLGVEILCASKQTSIKNLEDSIANGIPLNIVGATPIPA